MSGGPHMAAKAGDPISYDDEVENASIAIREEQQFGRTDRRCLRCGGRLIHEDLGSADVIRCENGDFKMVARGI
jgi:hypothetical protein